MMGADSVAYHRATAVNRSDDHPALAYDASRGETLLEWRGWGAGPKEAKRWSASRG